MVWLACTFIIYQMSNDDRREQAAHWDEQILNYLY